MNYISRQHPGIIMGSIDPSIPPFRYTLAASPDAEIWNHTDDTNKFQVTIKTVSKTSLIQNEDIFFLISVSPKINRSVFTEIYFTEVRVEDDYDRKRVRHQDAHRKLEREQLRFRRHPETETS